MKKAKSPWSTNKHERILQKAEAFGDGFKPHTVKEFLNNPRKYLMVKEEHVESAFIMRMDILFDFGGTAQHTWNERDTDKRRAQEKK